MKAFSIPYIASIVLFRYVTVTILILMTLLPAAYSEGPTFEVASIRPVPPLDLTRMPAQPSVCTGGPGTKDPGRWTCENTNLANIVRYAFDLKPYQLEGWYSQLYNQNKYFSIRAKVPEGATREQSRQMRQNLLIERFGLKFHFEKKETQGYELVVAKNGPKFKESDPESPQDSASELSSVPSPLTIGKDGFPTMPSGRSGVFAMATGARGQWPRTTMGDFAEYLIGSSMAGKPVIDSTALKGKYDLSLDWMPERRMSAIAPSAPAENSLPAAPQASGPDFFTALQEQLGLKLVPKKVTIEMFVVDHIEKTPTEN
jgi:uncharacterized protein (TIGR03435 family)